MKRRSVQNDPISAPERDRGAVIVNSFALDITKAAPVKPALKGERKPAAESK
ncbi:hypothetical protein [Kitasatospora viridis]|uniref:Uncharacterized protein n=1 Tax=Kitasatospora viridis TaxID=281105 RepID=A0A561SFN8_9ACTN|nr:hypothetical protein [Kitasatospora viridis]TWF73684.1 hypothetical protein FHX73_15300 [Kitasatospora viridis]